MSSSQGVQTDDNCHIFFIAAGSPDSVATYVFDLLSGHIQPTQTSNNQPASSVSRPVQPRLQHRPTRAVLPKPATVERDTTVGDTTIPPSGPQTYEWSMNETGYKSPYPPIFSPAQKKSLELPPTSRTPTRSCPTHSTRVTGLQLLTPM